MGGVDEWGRWEAGGRLNLTLGLFGLATYDSQKFQLYIGPNIFE